MPFHPTFASFLVLLTSSCPARRFFLGMCRKRCHWSARWMGVWVKFTVCQKSHSDTFFPTSLPSSVCMWQVIKSMDFYRSIYASRTAWMSGKSCWLLQKNLLSNFLYYSYHLNWMVITLNSNKVLELTLETYFVLGSSCNFNKLGIEIALE